jgi:hypothetical protein
VEEELKIGIYPRHSKQPSLGNKIKNLESDTDSFLKGTQEIKETYNGEYL